MEPLPFNWHSARELIKATTSHGWVKEWKRVSDWYMPLQAIEHW